jgi:hypothetical protein
MVTIFACGAGLFSYFLAALGLGAVMLTRFGSRPYFTSSPPSPPDLTPSEAVASTP